MVSNELRPQGTSIAENFGRPVTAADVRDLLENEGIPRGKIYRIMQAVQAALSWEHSKALRPWTHEGGLTQQDEARTAERRARLAEQLREEARARDAAREAALQRIAAEKEPDDGHLAEVIELPVIPGQTIADVVAEYAARPVRVTEEDGTAWLKDSGLRGDMTVTEVSSGLGDMAVLYSAGTVSPGPESHAAAPEAVPAPVTPGRVLTCRRCGLRLPEERFNRDRTRSTGRESRCGDCKSKDRKAMLEARSKPLPVAKPATAVITPAAAPSPQRGPASRAAASAGVPARTVKQCRGCGASKPLQAFQRNAASADGRRATCSDCAKEQRLARQQPPAPVMKQCRNCGQLRDVEKDFYHRAGRPVSNTCSHCEKEAARERRRQRPPAAEVHPGEQPQGLGDRVLDMGGPVR